MSRDVLETIDGALAAYGDAMRWSPEPQKADGWRSVLAGTSAARRPDSSASAWWRWTWRDDRPALAALVPVVRCEGHGVEMAYDLARDWYRCPEPGCPRLWTMEAIDALVDAMSELRGAMSELREVVGTYAAARRARLRRMHHLYRTRRVR